MSEYFTAQSYVKESDGSFTVKLPSDLIQKAKLGQSEFYSDYFRKYSKEYHRNGLNWSDIDLQRFFSEGLLRYYIGIITGYQFDYDYIEVDLQCPANYGNKIPDIDYKRNSNEARQVLANKVFRKNIDPQDIPDYLVKLRSIIEIFIKNKYLLRLGSDFQGIKLVVEDIGHKMNKYRGYDKAKYEDLPEPYKKLKGYLSYYEPLVDKIQAVIFFWVMDFSYKLIPIMHKHVFDMMNDYDTRNNSSCLLQEIKEELPRFIRPKYIHLIRPFGKPGTNKLPHEGDINREPSDISDDAQQQPFSQTEQNNRHICYPEESKVNKTPSSQCQTNDDIKPCFSGMI